MRAPPAAAGDTILVTPASGSLGNHRLVQAIAFSITDRAHAARRRQIRPQERFAGTLGLHSCQRRQRGSTLQSGGATQFVARGAGLLGVRQCSAGNARVYAEVGGRGDMNQSKWMVCLCLLVAALEVANAGPGDTLYTHPGTLVSGNGTRLNLYCTGTGSPAVVFDSGWGDWAPIWALVQPEVAVWTRACSYDRAGAGFSDSGPMPRTSVRIADELHSALRNAGVAGPYVLVASSFGGDNVRVFASRYNSDVAGLVFVESDTDDLEPADMQADDHRGQARFIPDLRACRDAIAQGTPLPPLDPGTPNRSCAELFFRTWPESAWSQELNDSVLRLARTKVAMYDAFISEMEQMPFDEAYLTRHRIALGDRPVRVLSTGNHGVGSLAPHPTSLKHLRYEYEVTLAQSRLLKLSSNAKQVFTKNSSEYIQLDEPGTVVSAIREVVDQSRAMDHARK
jgi:pimeloyl-ACP methyl ester carboxylesterase